MDATTNPHVRVNRSVAAHLALARRASTFGDDQVAADYARAALRRSPKIIEAPDARGYIAHFLTRAGDYDSARKILQRTQRATPTERLQLANTLVSDEPTQNATSLRIAELNAIFSDAGLAPVRLKDPESGLSIDNLHTVVEPRSRESQTKVSIIMAAYNSATHLATALESLLNQTWDNIEVIVVDDASTDDTLDVASRFAAMDSRVKVVACPVNGGAYAARNRGLEAATGEFVTTHDSDDWSHGQRIQIQVEAMLDDPKLKLTRSHVSRATPDLVFVPPTIRPTENWIHPNMSSVMVRASTLEDVGTWDELRAGGDGEFYRRVGATYGAQFCTDLMRQASVSFARVSEGSLTSTHGTSLLTLHQAAGARFLYRESYTRWQRDHAVHGRLPVGTWRSAATELWRPALMRSKAGATQSFDVVLISSLSAATSVGAAHARRESAKRVGILWQPDFTALLEGEPLRSLPEEFWVAVYDHGCQPVTFGQVVKTDLVLIDGVDAILASLDDAPEITARSAEVVISARDVQRFFAAPEIVEDIIAAVVARYGCPPAFIAYDRKVADELLERGFSVELVGSVS